MTNEEAIAWLEHHFDPLPDGTKQSEAVSLAIKALEQEPCDDANANQHNSNALNALEGDAISRQAVLDALYELCDTGETLIENPWRDNPHIDALVDTIEQLTSVRPQESNIVALGEELRMCQNSITDEKVLIGFNMAVALCNKHLGESEVQE